MLSHRNILLAAALLAAAACSAGGSPNPGLGTGPQQGATGGSPGGQGGALGTGTGGILNYATGGTAGADSGTTGATGGTTSTGPTSIDQCSGTNPGGFDATTTQKLMAGSGSAGALRILNPYDGTVFPRGLIAPLLMWDGVNADAVYVHVKSSNFEYKGCFKPTGADQLQFPQDVWEQLTAATGGSSDPFTLSLTVSSGGTATGPATEQIIVAKANLKGTIYYNTYKSKLVTPTDPIGWITNGQGAVLRIKPGKAAEVFLGKTQCTGCHSVSADGTRLVADPNPVFSTAGGASYAIDVNTAPDPPPIVSVPNGSFTGMSPDGKLYLSNGHPGGMGPRAGNTGSQGTLDAQLYETDTGNPVANTGIPVGAMTPMFSTDGTLLAFNDYAIGNGHGLATMTFDKTSRTASGWTKVFETTDTTLFPGWPFFFPDAKGIVFALGSASDFSGMATGLMGPLVGATSDLFFLDLASGTTKILARAMGFASEQDVASGTTYLPHGTGDLHHNFYPTVSPVAAGGYFWIFFDSYRHYGNTHAADGGLVRQLWGAAVDISPDGKYTTDPSHPPFYLTGQEDVLGNHRAFAALDPCHADGSTCTTGIDCCGGFCTNGKCEAPPKPEAGPVCAHTDESCANGTSCCDPTDRCIGGYCGQIVR